MIRQALILAAGLGGRLAANGVGPPKPLMPVGGVPLLSHVLARLEAAGVEEVCVVLGYRGEEIERHFRTAPPRLRMRWLTGADPQRSNGISVLHAQAALTEPFLLLMGDHLAPAATLRRLAATPLGSDAAALCVDRKLASIFDVEEATKVKLESDRITAIGKALTDYDAVDTGFFACTPALFEALAASQREGDCSLSDGIRALAEERRVRAVDIGGAHWIDVDTPQALRQAEQLLAAGTLPDA